MSYRLQLTDGNGHTVADIDFPAQRPCVDARGEGWAMSDAEMSAQLQSVFENASGGLDAWWLAAAREARRLFSGSPTVQVCTVDVEAVVEDVLGLIVREYDIDGETKNRPKLSDIIKRHTRAVDVGELASAISIEVREWPHDQAQKAARAAIEHLGLALAEPKNAKPVTVTTDESAVTQLAWQVAELSIALGKERRAHEEAKARCAAQPSPVDAEKLAEAIYEARRRDNNGPGDPWQNRSLGRRIVDIAFIKQGLRSLGIPVAGDENTARGGHSAQNTNTGGNSGQAVTGAAQAHISAVPVAHRTERGASNAEVAGSIPAGDTTQAPLGGAATRENPARGTGTIPGPSGATSSPVTSPNQPHTSGAAGGVAGVPKRVLVDVDSAVEAIGGALFSYMLGSYERGVILEALRGCAIEPDREAVAGAVAAVTSRRGWDHSDQAAAAIRALGLGGGA